MDPGWIARELFHLHVLRQLAVRLAARPYAVKGGICLRFFHRSPRLSEDMDLDIAPSVPVKTLQGHVDAILSSRALAASLRAQGVEAVEFTRPKQTETTQRWKAGLLLAGGVRLSTRLEFSRRRIPVEAERGIPGADLLRQAFLAPFAAAFYGAPMMACQKIGALASPSRAAARDLFDLHHLFSHASIASETLRRTIDSSILEKALEKVGRFEYRDFRDQVTPYLPGDLQTLYRDAAAFQTMREAVETRLMELGVAP